MNYQKLFWLFWQPHSFEAEKHKYKLYLRWKGKFVGLIIAFNREQG